MTTYISLALLMFASQATEPIPIDEVDIVEIRHYNTPWFEGGVRQLSYVFYWTNKGTMELRAWKYVDPLIEPEVNGSYESVGGYLF